MLSSFVARLSTVHCAQLLLPDYPRYSPKAFPQGIPRLDVARLTSAPICCFKRRDAWRLQQNATNERVLGQINTNICMTFVCRALLTEGKNAYRLGTAQHNDKSCQLEQPVLRSFYSALSAATQ